MTSRPPFTGRRPTLIITRTPIRLPTAYRDSSAIGRRSSTAALDMSDHPSPAFDERLPVDIISSSTTAAASTRVPSSSTPSSPFRPLPFLPMELKREIVLQCDQPTLAAMSLVSLALFELAAPLLYQDVIIEGVDGLRRLLCDRVSLLSSFIELI